MTFNCKSWMTLTFAQIKMSLQQNDSHALFFPGRRAKQTIQTFPAKISVRARCDATRRMIFLVLCNAACLPKRECLSFPSFRAQHNATVLSLQDHDTLAFCAAFPSVTRILRPLLHARNQRSRHSSPDTRSKGTPTGGDRTTTRHIPPARPPGILDRHAQGTQDP